MGCLKNVTRAIFLTVVVVGFMAFGGQDWIKTWFKNYINPSHDVILERAQKVGDFTKINKEFEIEKAAGIMGYNAVLAEDITSPDAEDKIKAAISKIKYQAAAVDEFTVTEKGTMRSYGQTVPYVKFKAKIKKLPIGEIKGFEKRRRTICSAPFKILYLFTLRIIFQKFFSKSFLLTRNKQTRC